MKVFITGATGYIGSAVAETFARAGHRVTGLVRSEAGARNLAAREVSAVAGSMEAPESYRRAAQEAQVLVHCAAEMSGRGAELDRTTVETLLAAAAEAGRPRLVVYTSGVWVLGDTGGEAADESAPLRAPAVVAHRVDTEGRVLGASTGAVRTLVLRPGCVYGGRGGLTGMWFASAAADGAARMVGDGGNRWSMVHVDDLARLYLLAAESPWGGEVFNATDRSRFTVRQCAEAASREAGAAGRVAAVPVEEAAAGLGGVAECLAMDQHVDSSKAVRLLGWQPRHAGFVDEVARAFAAWRAASGD